MSVVTLAIRIVPLTLIRRQIKNRFLRSFLYYVPYVTLAVMTFPAIMDATQTPRSGLLALFTGIALSWYGASLFKVSAACRRRGPQYQRSTGDNPLQEIFAF